MTSLRCTGCGSADVVVIDPGHEAVIDVVTDIMLRRGRPMSGRCLACLPALKGHQGGLELGDVPRLERAPLLRDATPTAVEGGEQGGLFDPITGR